MSKRQSKEELNLFRPGWEDKEIEYPFCVKGNVGKYQTEYTRYLEDGRFEALCIGTKYCSLQFGNYQNRIQSLIMDKEYYFKVLSNRFTVISSEEFDLRLKEYIAQHELYLNGTAFLAREVEHEIEKEKAKTDEQAIKINKEFENGTEDYPF